MNLMRRAQSAIFWSKWSKNIKEDLHNIISAQLTSSELSNYVALNFSKLPNPAPILKPAVFRSIIWFPLPIFQEQNR